MNPWTHTYTNFDPILKIIVYGYSIYNNKL